MCEYCKDVETNNDYYPLIEGTLDAGFLGKILPDVVILKNKDRKPALHCMVTLSQGMLDYDENIPINFCPICGRKF